MIYLGYVLVLVLGVFVLAAGYQLWRDFQRGEVL